MIRVGRSASLLRNAPLSRRIPSNLPSDMPFGIPSPGENLSVDSHTKYGSTLITLERQLRSMPVSIDEFESGDLPQGPSVPEQVVTYLYSHRDEAFTRSEIATAIDEDPNSVGTALTRLKDRDLVRHKGRYWAVTNDHERVVAAYDLHRTSERLDDSDSGIDTEDWDAVAPDRPHPSEDG